MERARNRASPTLVATATQAEKQTTKAPPQQQQQPQADKEGATSNSNYHPIVTSRLTPEGEKKNTGPQIHVLKQVSKSGGSPFTLYSSWGTYYVLPPYCVGPLPA